MPLPTVTVSERHRRAGSSFREAVESPVNLEAAFCILPAIHGALEEKFSGIGDDGALCSTCPHLSYEWAGVHVPPECSGPKPVLRRLAFVVVRTCP